MKMEKEQLKQLYKPFAIAEIKNNPSVAYLDLYFAFTAKYPDCGLSSRQAWKWLAEVKYEIFNERTIKTGTAVQWLNGEVALLKPKPHSETGTAPTSHRRGSKTAARPLEVSYGKLRFIIRDNQAAVLFSKVLQECGLSSELEVRK